MQVHFKRGTVMRMKFLAAVMASALVPAGCAGMGETSSMRLASGNLTPEDFARAKEMGDPIVCQIEYEPNTRTKKSQVCKHRSAWDSRAETDQRTFAEFRKYQTGPQ